MDSQTLKQGRGRPSKYKEEYPDQLLEYFAEYLRNPYTPEIVERSTKYYPTGQVKESIEKFKNVSREVPTLFGFALKKGIAYRTLLRWSKERVGTKPSDGDPDRRPYKYPDFCHAYKLAVEFQTQFINMAGMSGRTPPAFAIFAAKNMIGWRDDSTQRFVDADGKDRKDAPGYVLLPTRKTQAQAEDEAEEQGSAQGSAQVSEDGPVLPSKN